MTELRDSLLAQLEDVVHKARTEATSIDRMKAQLKELEALKAKHAEVKSQLLTAQRVQTDAEQERQQAQQQLDALRGDMQQLNDMVTAQREAKERAEQAAQQLSREAANHARELHHLKKEYQAVKQAHLSVAGALENERASAASERKAAERSIADLETKLAELHKEKDDLGRHFWNVTEDHKLLKDDFRQLHGQLQVVDQQLQASHQRAVVAEERVQMISCDQESRKALQQATHWEKLQATVDHLTQENRQLAGDLETKQNELLLVCTQLRTTQQEMEHLHNNCTELVSVAESEQSSSISLRAELHATHSKLRAMEAEIVELNERLRNTDEQHKADLAEARASHHQQHQKDVDRYEALNRDYAAVRKQMMEASERQWTLSQQLSSKELNLSQIQQDTEAQLLEYTQRLEELQLEHDTFKQQTEAANRQSESKIQELEARITKQMEDLGNANKALQQEREQSQTAAEKLHGVEEMIKTREDLLLQTFDREKKRFAQEISVWKNKVADNQRSNHETLMELQDCETQLKSKDNELRNAHERVEQLSRQLQQTQSQIDDIQHENQRLLQELKFSSKEENQSKQEHDRTQAELRTQIQTLEANLKEARRLAAEQVQGFSVQAKQLAEELNQSREETDNCKQDQMRLNEEVLRLQAELENRSQDHDAWVSKATREIAMLRNESERYQNEVKVQKDAKSKNDLELQTLKVQSTQNAMELERHRESQIDLNHRCANLEQQLRDCAEERNELREDNGRLRKRNVELENDYVKRRRALESTSQQLVAAQEHAEQREQELQHTVEVLSEQIAELRQSLHTKSQELVECRNRQSKMQSSMDSKVSNLTDEISSVASSLDEERRRIARMTEVHGAEAMELKMTLERTKSEMQKALLDAQRERADEAQRAFDAERELRGLKMKNETNEMRVKELERQLKASKDRLQEARDQLNEATNERLQLENLLNEERSRPRRQMLSTSKLDLNKIEPQSAPPTIDPAPLTETEFSYVVDDFGEVLGQAFTAKDSPVPGDPTVADTILATENYLKNRKERKRNREAQLTNGAAEGNSTTAAPGAIVTNDWSAHDETETEQLLKRQSPRGAGSGWQLPSTAGQSHLPSVAGVPSEYGAAHRSQSFSRSSDKLPALTQRGSS